MYQRPGSAPATSSGGTFTLLVFACTTVVDDFAGRYLSRLGNRSRTESDQKKIIGTIARMKRIGHMAAPYIGRKKSAGSSTWRSWWVFSIPTVRANGEIMVFWL